MTTRAPSADIATLVIQSLWPRSVQSRVFVLPWRVRFRTIMARERAA
jgi:hypothetical protein